MNARSYIRSRQNSAKPLIRRLLRDDAGQDLIEYALLFCFVAMAAIASMKSMGTAIAAVFSTVGNTLTTAT